MPSEDIKAAKQVLREALATPFGVFDGDEVAQAIRAILAHVDALEAEAKRLEGRVEEWRTEASHFDAQFQRAEARVSVLEGVLRGYRAASHWIGADSWDGCSDCMDILRAAAAADPDREMSSDEIAGELKAIRSGATALRDARYLAALSIPAPVKEEVKPAAEGWVLVPREITLEMQHAYFDVIDKNLRRVETDAAFGRFRSQEEAYRALLAAAPASSPPEARREEIARIIDPDGWASWDRRPTAASFNKTPEDYCKRSLAKADAILALKNEEGREC